MAVLAKREKGSIISCGIKVKLCISLQWVIKVYKYDIEMFFFNWTKLKCMKSDLTITLNNVFTIITGIMGIFSFLFDILHNVNMETDVDPLNNSPVIPRLHTHICALCIMLLTKALKWIYPCSLESHCHKTPVLHLLYLYIPAIDNTQAMWWS